MQRRGKSMNHHYRILKEPMPNFPFSTNEESPQKATERILKSKKYLYIDMNEQETGCKLMERIQSGDSEEETEKIGDSYISNLKSLSDRSQQTHEYLLRIKEFRSKKDKLKKIVKRELQNSHQNIAKRKNNKANSAFRRPLHLSYDTETIKNYLQNEELQRINNGIIQKQMSLIQKLGTISDYKSVSRERRRINIGKFNHLPKLTSKTIQY